MTAESVLRWLMDGDPAIRWQAMRDLKGAAERTVLREQRRVTAQGWGAVSSSYRICSVPRGNTHRADSQARREVHHPRCRQRIPPGLSQPAFLSRQHVDLSVEKANLQLQVDWDGDPPPPAEVPKLDDAAETVLRKVAGEMGMPDAGEDDLRKLLTQIYSPTLDDAKLQDTVMRLSQSDPSIMGEVAMARRRLEAPSDWVSVSLPAIAHHRHTSALRSPSLAPLRTPFRRATIPWKSSLGAGTTLTPRKSAITACRCPATCCGWRLEPLAPCAFGGPWYRIPRRPCD